jgi:serine/threonine protein kinase
MLDNISSIGDYKITRSLGVGGMGHVFLGHDANLDRSVAIKVLKPEITSRPDILARFKNEALTLAKLHHGNICSLYAFLEVENSHVMVMQYIDGESLEDEVKRERKLTVERSIKLIKDILHGLIEAHSYGIVHRDIKPLNVMISKLDGRAVIMDFGIAKAPQQVKTTREGAILATLEYASPEQLRGEQVDHRTDLYSLGVLAYELLLGKLPFSGDSEYALIQDTLKTKIDLVEINQISEQLALFIEKATTKNKEKRFQSAHEMLVRLDNISSFTPPKESFIKKILEAISTSYSNNSVIWNAVGILLGLFFIVLANGYPAPEPKKEPLAIQTEPPKPTISSVGVLPLPPTPVPRPLSSDAVDNLQLPPPNSAANPTTNLPNSAVSDLHVITPAVQSTSIPNPLADNDRADATRPIVKPLTRDKQKLHVEKPRNYEPNSQARENERLKRELGIE